MNVHKFAQDGPTLKCHHTIFEKQTLSAAFIAAIRPNERT